jgi:hypothetical protein
VNDYVVYRDAGRPFDYKKFILAISRALREKGVEKLHSLHTANKPGGLQQMKWPNRPLTDLEEGTQHQRVKIKRGRCRICLREDTRGARENRGALIAISSNVDRFSVTTRMSVTGCDVCRVPLCDNKYCWNQYHWWGGLQVGR